MILTRFDPEIHLPGKLPDDDDFISHVFYVLSWGYGADHWFSWMVKSINSHPEMLAYLANEGSRPKYFPEERSRAHRPDPLKFTRFMADVGMTYTAIADCYSYRCPMMEPVRKLYGDSVRMVELVRNPYAFLFFHVRWRSRNMRMLSGENGPLEHEWNAADHERFRSLGLKSYNKEDVEIWSLYQGMMHLDVILADGLSKIPLQPVEDVINDRSLFCALIAYLTHGRVKFSKELLDEVYSWTHQVFRGEELLSVPPEKWADEWPDWKHDAMQKLVSMDTIRMFKLLGYNV